MDSCAVLYVGPYGRRFHLVRYVGVTVINGKTNGNSIVSNIRAEGRKVVAAASLHRGARPRQVKRLSQSAAGSLGCLV